MSNHRGLISRVGKFAYIASLMGVLGYGAYGFYGLNISFWQRLVELIITPSGGTIRIVLGSALLIPLLEWIETRSSVGRRWMDWSLFSRNINFVPMDYVLLRVPFLVLLYFNLPLLAWVEEMIFRHDWFIHPTVGWADAVWRSVVFGLLHVVGGVKIRAVLPLTLGGLWFSFHYFGGGVLHATLAHTAMNVTGLTLMLVSWARTGKNPFA